jgi:hypothetical protein
MPQPVEIAAYIGPIAVGTAVETSLGLGYIVGHVIDQEQHVTGYLVTFDYWTPGNLRPDRFVPEIGWLFKPADITIYAENNKRC